MAMSLLLFLCLSTFRVAYTKDEPCLYAVNGDTFQMDFNYSPVDPDLFSIAWYRGTGRIASDQIVFFQPPIPVQYGTGYSETTVGFLYGTNYTGLNIFSRDPQRLGEYEVVVFHTARYNQIYNISNIKADPFDGVILQVDNIVYAHDTEDFLRSDIDPTGRSTFTLEIPTGLTNDFMVFTTDDGQPGKNYTQKDCSATTNIDTCTVEIVFDEKDEELRVITITLDLLLCTNSSSITSFELAIIVGSCRCWVFCIAEIICCSLKLCVIFPVCELVILKEKKAANIRQRNMWIAVGVGVAVDIIVAVVDIVLSDCDECHVVVLGVNLGLALGCSAAFLIYAGLRHKTITDEYPKEPAPDYDLGGNDTPRKDTLEERHGHDGHRDQDKHHGERIPNPTTTSM